MGIQRQHQQAHILRLGSEPEPRQHPLFFFGFGQRGRAFQQAVDQGLDQRCIRGRHGARGSVPLDRMHFSHCLLLDQPPDQRRGNHHRPACPGRTIQQDQQMIVLKHVDTGIVFNNLLRRPQCGHGQRKQIIADFGQGQPQRLEHGNSARLVQSPPRMRLAPHH